MAPREDKGSLNQALKNWANYLDGNKSVNIFAWLLISGPSIYFGFLTYSSGESSRALFELINISITQCVIFIGLVLGKPIILGKRKKSSAFRILGLYFFAASLSSLYLVIALGIGFIPITTGVSAWIVFSLGSLVQVTWLSVAHLVTALWTDNLKLVQELKIKAAQLESLRVQSQEALSRELNALREMVSRRIDKVLQGIDEQVRNLDASSRPTQILASAKKVQDLSNYQVRQLSHEIAGSEIPAPGLTPVNYGFRQVWREALRGSSDANLYWPWVAGIGSINAITLAMQRNGLPDLAAFAVGLAIGVVVLRTLDILRVALTRTSPEWFKALSVLILYMVANFLVTGLIAWIGGFIPVIAEFANLMVIAVPVATLFLWVMVFFIRGFIQNQRVRALDLESQSALLEVEIQRALAATLAARQKLSKLLHGTVQGRLASVSLALTASASAETSQLADEYLKKAKIQLDLTREDLNSTLWADEDEEDVNSQLADMISSWESIVSIEQAISKEAANFLNSRPDIGSHVLQAHREAITNAARHSTSREISITIDVEPRLDPDQIIFVAKNTTQKPLEKNEPGFGILSLKDFAASVELDVKNGQATLKVIWNVEDFKATAPRS